MTEILRAPWYSVSVTLTALICCISPLTNVLGYEFSLFVGLVASLVATVAGVSLAQDAPEPRSFSETLLAAWVPLLPALLLGLLNALRVRNCDLGEGFIYFAVIVLPSSLFGLSVGMLLGATTETRHPHRASFGLWGVSLAVSLIGFYLTPPIFVFNHWLGFLAGSLYDEALRIDSRLLFFRSTSLLMALGLWWAYRQQANRDRLKARARWSRVGVAIVAVTLLGWLSATQSGAWRSNGSLKQALPRKAVAKGLELHAFSGIAPESLAALTEDLAFQRARLLGKLAHQSDRIITVFVYRDEEQKGQLMGGYRTQFAKPWLGQIHIHGTAVPHHVGAHELVHALMADFGSSFLAVSARAEVGINMAIIEGVAVALAPSKSPLDLHLAAKAMRDLDLAPLPRHILGPTGFWSQAPARAYTIAGSFFRFLNEKFGPKPLKEVYRTGAFDHAYGLSLPHLEDQWLAYLNKLEPTDEEEALADDRFRRPSIFARVCAREIAQLRHEAARLPPTDALPLERVICKHLDNQPAARLQLSLSAASAGEHAEFERLFLGLRDDPQLTKQQRALLHLEAGKVAAKAEETDESRRRYATAYALAAEPHTKREVWVRLWAVDQDADLRDHITGLFEEGSPGSFLELAARFDEEAPEPTLAYLLGRRLAADSKCGLGLRRLEQPGTHPDPWINFERARLRAQLLVDCGVYIKAGQAFAELEATAPLEGLKHDARLMSEKIAWLEEQTASK